MAKSEKNSNQQRGIHIVAKPIGPRCNLNCEYCFYLEKQVLFPRDEEYVMSDAVLEAYITNYIASQPTPVVEFVWQGGEPTLLGVDFYRRVIEQQRSFVDHKQIINSLQTNGTLLTDEWCAFLKANNFLVGISLDGPREIHDRYRRDCSGNGTFDKVMQGVKLLQEHGVEYNVMATVARETAYHALDVYRFFREENIEFIQFAPVVERTGDCRARELGLKLAGHSALEREEHHVEVTEWSVEPKAYGDFLIEVFEEWVRNDVGTINVMNFEWALHAWIGNPAPVCQHAQECGKSLMMEHNGDLYACDHSMYPEYRLGNIVHDAPLAMAQKSLDQGFGTKEVNLPSCCMECEVRNACWGGCPKHRFGKSHNGEAGLQYLCEGYKKFFSHTPKYLHAITQLLERGLPASYIMEALKGPLVIHVPDNK